MFKHTLSCPQHVQALENAHQTKHMDQLQLDDDLRAKYSNALPYLTVLPINEQRLDLSILDRVQPHLAQHLLERLLHPAQDVSIHIPLGIQNNTLPERISQLKALQRSFERFALEAKQWTIGFPLLVWEDQALGRRISAPLFLWQVHLQPALGDGGDWVIRPSDGNQGYLNPILKSYLEHRLDFQWNQTIGLVDAVDAAAITRITEQLAEHLGAAPLSELTPEHCPMLESEQPAQWRSSLILGHFEPLTAKDNRKLPKDLQAKHRQSWVTKLPAVACSAEQEALLAAAFAGHHAVVEGVDGTGKTEAIVAALPSLLADQGTALVVVPDTDALRNLQERLEAVGLRHLGILTLQDPVLDKERLISYLERLPKHSRQLPNFNNATYSEQLHAYRVVRQQLIDAHQALHHPSLEGQSWTEWVGEALQAHDQYHRQLLGRFLSAENFEFNQQEYQDLEQELKEHYPFFEPLDALKHPLNALHGRFFADDAALQDTLDRLPPLVHQYRHKIQRLYERYLVLIGEYAEYWQLQYRDWVNRLERQIDKIEGDLLLYNRVYGEAFDKQSSFQDAKLKVLSLFSSRYQAIRAAKAQLLRDYQQLKEDYLRTGYLDAPFPDIKEEPRLADVALQLEQVRQQLHQWRAGIHKRVEEQSRALQADSALPVPFDQQAQQLEAALQQLLEQFNEAKVLRAPVETPALLLSERVAGLLQLILQCQKLENHWDDLAAYFRWRHSWRQLSGHAQRVVQGLVQAGAKQWTTAFKSWYIHQYLLRHYQSALPIGTEHSGLPYEHLLTLQRQLQPQVLAKAERAIKERQSEQIKRIKREKDLSLSKVRRIFKNKQLKDILDWIGLEHLGSLFPVVLTTAELAPYLLPATVPIVDWVVLDKAHLLPADLGTQLLQLGNQHLVLGTTVEAEDTPSSLSWMLEQQGRKPFQFTEVFQFPGAVLVDPEDDALAEPQTQLLLAPSKPTAFHQWLVQRLRPYIDEGRLTVLPRPEEHLVIDLLIFSDKSRQKPHAILLDGGLLHRPALDFERAVVQRQRLHTLEYEVWYEWSVQWWQQPEEALEQFLARVLDQPLAEAKEEEE